MSEKLCFSLFLCEGGTKSRNLEEIKLYFDTNLSIMTLLGFYWDSMRSIVENARLHRK